MAFGDYYALKNPSELGKKSKLLLNKRIYKRLVAHVQHKPLKMLEVGVGHGFFAEICRTSGQHFFGVEPNTNMYNALVERDFAVKQSYCPPIPYDSGEFDVVYAGYVLEFLRDPECAYEFVSECYRVLGHGGIVAFVCSDYMKMGKEFWNVAYMASFATTERRVRQLLFDTGFEFRDSVFFAGNLFGPWRYLAYGFYKLYSYHLLNAIFRQRQVLDSRFYKLRVTFPEGFLVIGGK